MMLNWILKLGGFGKMSKMKGIKFRVASKDASKLWKAVKEMKKLKSKPESWDAKDFIFKEEEVK
mgnify:CR=1 FL=1